MIQPSYIVLLKILQLIKLNSYLTKQYSSYTNSIKIIVCKISTLLFSLSHTPLPSLSPTQFVAAKILLPFYFFLLLICALDSIRVIDSCVATPVNHIPLSTDCTMTRVTLSIVAGVQFLLLFGCIL